MLEWSFIVHATSRTIILSRILLFRLYYIAYIICHYKFYNIKLGRYQICEAWIPGTSSGLIPNVRNVRSVTSSKTVLKTPCIRSRSHNCQQNHNTVNLFSSMLSLFLSSTLWQGPCLKTKIWDAMLQIQLFYLFSSQCFRTTV